MRSYRRAALTIVGRRRGVMLRATDACVKLVGGCLVSRESRSKDSDLQFDRFPTMLSIVTDASPLARGECHEAVPPFFVRAHPAI